MSARTVLRVNASVVLAIGMALLIPLLLSLPYRDGSWISFLFPAVALIVVGSAAMRAIRPPGRGAQFVSNRDVYLSVTLAWTLAALLGGVPFLIEGTFHSLITSREGARRNLLGDLGSRPIILMPEPCCLKPTSAGR